VPTGSKAPRHKFRRDHDGAIRYADTGGLPFSAQTCRRNAELLGDTAGRPFIEAVTDDIFYFLGKEASFFAPSCT
jgi:hypothetical protein